MQEITASNGSRQPMFLAILGFLLFLSTVTVLLRYASPTHNEDCEWLTVGRLYCRTVHIQYVGIDDYFIVTALIVVFGMSVANIIHISYGTG